MSIKTAPQITIQDRALIGGRWVAARSGAEIQVTDPTTDRLIATVPRAGAADARDAVDAASQALPSWRVLPGSERSKLLRRLYELMMRDQDRLGRLMTEEQGKPLAEARGEIAYAAGFIEWSAEEAKRIYGETVQAFVANKRILVLRQPIGVAAAITPWNFPAAMITRKVGPALAAGCTVVVKPASQTPLTAIAIGALAMEAGFPAGVLNILPGIATEIAEAWLSDSRVRVLSFTGSTEVGKELMTKAAEHVTRISLELGGHAPFLVFDDADLEAAVAGAVDSKFRNAGQTCVCANRVYVQSGIYDRFAARLTESVEALKVGPGTEPGVKIGALVDDRAMAKVEDHVANALSLGAKIRTGGRRLPQGDGYADRFYAPTVIEDVTPDMKVSFEETFGPVAPLIRFDTEEEAIRLDYGIVGANDGLPSTPQAPFGGMKESGIGREGGKWGVEEYLEVKYVSWGI
ncbi:MAG: NAD-dependent succinate-semialdehyde dehydrogenase [Chloroflexi bacterium]|nr:MAG: NAD-dependent succinate-semialdehyde dehydrogenase [Chloroflexota bacterium]